MKDHQEINQAEKRKNPFFLATTLLALFTLVCSAMLHAQLCQGSLGDPIVDIDFGTGTSVHAGPLSSGITSYTYSSADFPMDGSYTVENSTAGSGSVWWSTTDHTGNTGGYMMVVNASISLTDYFYRNTITGLCPGTLYEFASWVMNLLRSSDLSPPNITFSIEQTDGTVINSYTTGPISLQSSPLWRQFGFYFSTPPGVSTVVIIMRNNSAGGRPANDIALDDITFRPCGPDIKAWFVTSSGIKDTVCTGTTLSVEIQGSVSSGYTNPTIQWQEFVNGSWQDIPGANSTDYSLPAGSLTDGDHRYRLAASEGGNYAYQQCRVESDPITLTVEPGPTAAYSVIRDTVCSNQAVQFIDNTVSARPLAYQWSFGDGSVSTEQNPGHLYAQAGSYHTSLIVSNAVGCTDTAEIDLTITLLPIPTVTITVDPGETSIFYPTVTVTEETGNATGCSISWGDGTVTDCSDTVHDYLQAGTYTVMEIVENTAGCTDTAFVTVVIRAEYRFFIPNAFTPDGDGLNDIFRPLLVGAEQYTFLIFNRFGQQLFETHDPSAGWDGRCGGSICPEQNYVYKISLYDEADGRSKVYSGTFVLLRK